MSVKSSPSIGRRESKEKSILGGVVGSSGSGLVGKCTCG